MKNRNPLVVFLLGFLTCGIYGWYWFIKTKDEMNKMGEKIPTLWIWLIPIVGTIWWCYKYAEGVAHLTPKELNTFLAMIAMLLLGPIGQAIVQEAFNRITTPVAAATVPPSSVYQPGTTVLPPIPPIKTAPLTSV